MPCCARLGLVPEGRGLNKVLLSYLALILKVACSTGTSLGAFNQDGNTRQLGVQLPIPQFEKRICFRPSHSLQGMGAGSVPTVTSSTVSLPTSLTLPSGWWQKTCRYHHLLRHISHPAEQTRNHMVGGISSRRMEVAGGNSHRAAAGMPAMGFGWTWTGHFTHLSASTTSSGNSAFVPLDMEAVRLEWMHLGKCFGTWARPPKHWSEKEIGEQGPYS